MFALRIMTYPCFVTTARHRPSLSSSLSSAGFLRLSPHFTSSTHPLFFLHLVISRTTFPFVTHFLIFLPPSARHIYSGIFCCSVLLSCATSFSSISVFCFFFLPSPLFTFPVRPLLLSLLFHCSDMFLPQPLLSSPFFFLLYISLLTEPLQSFPSRG